MVRNNTIEALLFVPSTIKLIAKSQMGLLAKWNSLPIKARYYIGISTFIFAVVGDYATSRINEEVREREKIVKELNSQHEKSSKV